MRIIALIVLTTMVSVGTACAQDQSPRDAKASTKNVQIKKRHNDNPRPYDLSRDAMADVDAALKAASENGTKALIVMGANWCHDSRGFAGRMERPEFETLLSDNYELVYVSAGDQPRQNDQNADVSKRFGVEKISGTPTIFIVDSTEQVLNSESAGYWRNADSIPVDMSYAYLEHYAQK